jgi:hypothetical protein
VATAAQALTTALLAHQSLTPVVVLVQRQQMAQPDLAVVVR